MRLPRLWVLLPLMVVAACSSTTTSGASTEPVVSSTEAATTTTATTTTALSERSTTTTALSEPSTTTTARPEVARVRTGAQVLADQNFGLLHGQRVGLIAHAPSRVEVDEVDVHVGDALHAHPEIDLVALFGPEHGIRGIADAGEAVDDEIDAQTGAPVFSLYGATRQPTSAMLADIDVVVYDLQDVGTRYYTYISTMGLAMQAAADNGIEFVVLDRPNPLGGGIGGGLLQEEFTSFVGQYPIPDQYGLTAGELARLIVTDELLPGLGDLSLTVVPMDGWTRDMRWPDTGLPWIAPSPALGEPTAALLYPATIWFEATSLSYGRGTQRPFQMFGAPWLDAQAAADELNSRQLPGVAFKFTEITPEMLPGMTVEPAYVGVSIPVVQIEVVDPRRVEPTTLGMHLLEVTFSQASDNDLDPLSRPDWLDLLSGNPMLGNSIRAGERDAPLLIERQDAQSEPFEAIRQRVLMYD